MKTFEEIAAGVYLISAGRANSYLLVGDDLTLVDDAIREEQRARRREDDGISERTA